MMNYTLIEYQDKKLDMKRYLHVQSSMQYAQTQI